MENQTDFKQEVEMSTTMQPLNISSTSISSTDIFENIAANDLISRANYVYGICALLGFASACFLLHGFVQSYRSCRSLVWLDTLLGAFSGFQILLLHLSLSSVVHRPRYLETTPLGCAALAFAVNLTTLCGLFTLVLMGYALTYDPPTHPLMKRPGVCVALVVLLSVLCSLVLATLRDSSRSMDLKIECVIDPTKAGSSYAIAKLCLGILFPYIILLGLLIGSCIRQWKSNSRFLSGSENGPVFMAVAGVMFASQLFHGVVLVRGACMNQTKELSPHERAFTDVSEFVMFSGSCVCLVLVLLLHRSSRESFLEVMRWIRSCCLGLGGRPTHRHIMAPQIEIADTQSYDF